MPRSPQMTQNESWGRLGSIRVGGWGVSVRAPSAASQTTAPIARKGTPDTPTGPCEDPTWDNDDLSSAIDGDTR